MGSWAQRSDVVGGAVDAVGAKGVDVDAIGIDFTRLAIHVRAPPGVGFADVLPIRPYPASVSVGIGQESVDAFGIGGIAAMIRIESSHAYVQVGHVIISGGDGVGGTGGGSGVERAGGVHVSNHETHVDPPDALEKDGNGA